MMRFYSYNFMSFMAFSLLISCKENQQKENATDQGDTSFDSSYIFAASLENTVISKQSTIKVNYQSFTDEFTLEGYVIPDERRTNKIASRIGGRIEKLHVQYPWQYVTAGEKLIELYSPELSTHIEEYIYLLEKNDLILVQKAKEKLLLLGISEHQLSEINKSKQVPHTITLYASQNGFVLPPENTFASTGKMKSDFGNRNIDGMNMGATNMKMDQSAPSNLNMSWLREGMYVSKDQVLFVLNDLDKVWGMVMGNTLLTKRLKPGMKVSIFPEQTPEHLMDAEIDLIEPVYENDQKFTKIRLYMNNPDHALQINSLFRIRVPMNRDSVVILPKSAVLDLGKRTVVWVKTGRTNSGTGIFEIREVISETSGKGELLIISGIRNDEEVAEQAGLLLDSETLVK